MYDHHHTQKSLVSELEKLNLSNISITFNSELKFGAVKMLVDKYEHLLTKEQIIFFTKIVIQIPCLHKGQSFILEKLSQGQRFL